MAIHRVDQCPDEIDERNLAVESPNIAVRAFGHINSTVGQSVPEEEEQAI